ncbi:MAG: hypothetical protein PHO20_02260 [Candidatus Peribacteraceae bacterium]|nr:hypothetical protein [Candidatus Peribacteraceae bacterium]
MVQNTFIIGILGSLLLVIGAAWPDKPVPHPARSTKNWLFAIGGLGMFFYAFLGYLSGGSIFYVFLQVFVMIASLFMMLNVPDAIDTPLIAIAGIGFVIWSLMLFEGFGTIFFILGLCGIGIGYALDTGTLKREACLTAGSILIALFSYLEGNWIFFWLNLFFALFSGWYVWKFLQRSPRSKPL